MAGGNTRTIRSNVDNITDVAPLLYVHALYWQLGASSNLQRPAHTLHLCSSVVVNNARALILLVLHRHRDPLNVTDYIVEMCAHFSAHTSNNDQRMRAEHAP